MRGHVAIVLSILAACGGGHVGTNADARVADAGPPDAASCAGLDLDACRLATGCVADLCEDCACGETFNGCRRPDEQPANCPDLGCAQPICCRSNDDCAASSQECRHPGESPGCGVPNIDPGDCVTDDDCMPGTTGMICDPIACSQTGAFHCVPGCTGNGDCPTGQSCSAGDRCVSQFCDDQTPCPDDFHCDEMTCAQNVCVVDTDCVGFCVEGLCYPGLGECQPIPQ